MSAGIGPVLMRHLSSWRGQVDGHQFVAVLHAHVGGGAAAVDPDVAGRLAGGMRLASVQVLAVPAVDVHVVAGGCRRHQPLHVGREPQVVRVDDAAHDALDLGRARIDEGQRVGQRVGDDDRLLVRRHVQVVRLLAGGQARISFQLTGSITLTWRPANSARRWARSGPRRRGRRPARAASMACAPPPHAPASSTRAGATASPIPRRTCAVRAGWRPTTCTARRSRCCRAAARAGRHGAGAPGAFRRRQHRPAARQPVPVRAAW
jgi:hypothetical protein